MSKARWIWSAMALWAAAMGPALAQARMDAQVEAAARCDMEKPMPPELAAFRLLQTSRVVVREPLGSMVVYLGSLDPKATVNLYGMTPSRWAVITRSGQPDALVGALYSSEAPIDDAAIAGSYQGGVKRKVELVAFSAANLTASGVRQAYLSTGAVKGPNSLMIAILKSGDRLVVCAPVDQIRRFSR